MSCVVVSSLILRATRQRPEINIFITSSTDECSTVTCLITSVCLSLCVYLCLSVLFVLQLLKVLTYELNFRCEVTYSVSRSYSYVKVVRPTSKVTGARKVK